ncbi:LAQU0S06e05666g1_1 [Lachancea quebecensis]|uniref:LAQU0S06e05666g1_1 n=1 Tax=Lachancea quebecensis TaxID=1654605 RepID=A0A0P1KS69_9SACH|nr:LAQU0S06e05666g1_1 [Lachancea quebecensis]
MPYPKISIRFCTKCKWNLRSAWYLQELLQTFQSSLGEVSLIPGEPGEFRVLGYKEHDQPEIIIWDRTIDGGFPDSKYLKQKVKQLLLDADDQGQLGAHINRKAQTKNLVDKTDCSSSGHCLDCES